MIIMLYKIGTLKNLTNSLETVLESAGLWPATLLKMTLAHVFSYKFWEIFENIFFAEHLWMTASAIPYKCRHLNTSWELAFSKYLLEELLLLILCWSFKSTWSLLRNSVCISFLINLKLFLKRDSGRVAFYKLCKFSRWLLMSNVKNMKIMRATIFWSINPTLLMTSTYTILHYKISKASYINICQTQSKVYNLLYLPQGTSDNIFKVQSLAYIKVGGNVRS